MGAHVGVLVAVQDQVDLLAQQERVEVGAAGQEYAPTERQGSWAVTIDPADPPARAVSIALATQAWWVSPAA